MSIRINMTPVINFDEIEDEYNLHLQDFDFPRRIDYNEGYFWVNTDEDAVIDLENLIDEEMVFARRARRFPDNDYIQRVKNDIFLVKELRKMGLTSGVILYVWY